MTRSDVVLIAGYALAVPPLLRIRSLARRRNAIVFFGVLEVGQVLVAVGWAMKGKAIPCAINASAALAYPAYWLVRGQQLAFERVQREDEGGSSGTEP